MSERFKLTADQLHLTARGEAHRDQKYIEYEEQHGQQDGGRRLDEEKRIVVRVVRRVGHDEIEIHDVLVIVADRSVVVFYQYHVFAERQGTGHVKDQRRQVYDGNRGREPHRTLSPTVQRPRVPVTERRETVPGDRQTVPNVGRAVDDDPHLEEHEQPGFRFPKIIYAYGHVVLPVVNTADVHHRRDDAQVQHYECQGDVVDVLAPISRGSGIEHLV